MSAGPFSLAHPAFAAAGAYTSALLTLQAGASFALALTAGIVAAALLALVAGLMTVRLSGLYLSIGTLAFGETFLIVVNQVPFLGGPTGLGGIPIVATGPVILVAFAAVVIVSIAIGRSDFDRRFRAAADDELAAGALGLRVRVVQVQAFVVGGALAGLSGALSAHQLTIVTPGDFGFNLSLSAILAVFLGGRETVTGPVLGAAGVIAIPEVARLISLPSQLLLGILLIVIIALLPEGILRKRFGSARSRFDLRLLSRFGR
jgi:branched-chain amino acid transport system permease protein